MERVLGNSEKLIYDGGAGAQGVVPYLPLGELTPKRQPTTGQPQGGATVQGGTVR
jgi:membrane protease subunit HflK